MVVVLAPAAVVAGLMALLFLLGWYYFGNTIVKMLSVNLPIIGNVIGNAVAEVAEGTYAILVYWLDAALGPVTSLILGPIVAVENVITSARGAIANLYVTTSQIIGTRLPWLEQTVVAYTDQVVATTESNVLGYVNTATAALHATDVYLSGDIDQAYARAVAYTAEVGATALDAVATAESNVLGYVNQADAALLGELTAGLNQAEAFTVKAYDAATGYAATLAGDAAAALDHAITDLEGFANATATAAVGALVTDIDNSIVGALGGIYTDLDTAITDVVGVIGTGDADVLAGIRAIPFSVPVDIAGVTSLAGATALTLTRYLRDCGIPNCQNLSQFGQELQALLGFVADASFLALLVELVHNPTEASAVVNDAFGGQISSALGLTKTLLGV